MKILFYWNKAFLDNDNCDSIEALSLKITHKENEFATAIVEIVNKNVNQINFFERKYAKILCDGKEFFYGRLIAFPVSKNNASIIIELISEPEDYQQKLTNFSVNKLQNYKSISNKKFVEGLIPFDDLFFSKPYNPTAFLEGNSELFYWDQKNGELMLSSITKGERICEINSDLILKNSFKVRFRKEPYQKINVILNAEWIQSVRGIIDIFPIIASRFELQKVNSFTKLKDAFFNAFMFFKEKGYNIIHTEINEVNPNSGFNNFPLLSPKFFSKDKKDFINFERFYYDGKILLEWHYKQKRREVINFCIENSHIKNCREKNIQINLNELTLPKEYPNWGEYQIYDYKDEVIFKGAVFSCEKEHVSQQNFEPQNWKFLKNIPDALDDDSKSSFFASLRGKNAIKFAIQKALSNICYSNRYIEISFAVEAKNFLDVSLKDEIIIPDENFIGRKICGKVIKKQIIIENNSQIIIFTIGCSEHDQRDFIENLNYKINEYVKSINIKTDDHLNSLKIIKKIEIINPPEKQIEICGEEAQKISEIEKILISSPTKIKLQFNPLNTVRVIENEIKLPNFLV